MRRMMFGIFALLVLSAAVFAQNDTAAADKEFLQARYSFVYANAQKAMVAMDATIEYLGSQGISTAVLLQERESFEEKLGELKAAADAGDRAQFEAVNAEMHQIASQFGEQVSATNASAEQIRDRITTRLQEQNRTLANASNAAWANAEGGAMTAFDAHYANAERTVETMRARGYNMSQTDSLLAGIAAKRTELQAAYQSQNRAQVKALQTEIQGLYKQFRTGATSQYMNRVNSIIGSAGKYIDTIGGMGGDTGGLSGKYQSMQQNSQQVQNACSSGTPQECKNAVQQLRNEFMNFRDEAKGEMNAARERNENQGAGSSGGKENETNEFGNGTGRQNDSGSSTGTSSGNDTGKPEVNETDDTSDKGGRP